MIRRKVLTSLLVILAGLLFCTWTLGTEAWARAGGGKSMGSRGSHSMSAPKAYTPSTPVQPSRPTTPSPGVTTPSRPTTPPPTQQPSSFWRSFGGGMLGGLAGGLLFRSLFGGAPAYGSGGGGFGGGIGIFDILLLCGIGYLIYWYIKKKRNEAAAEGPYYQSRMEIPDQGAQQPYQPTLQPAYYEQPAGGDEDLEKGLGYIRQMDSSFNEERFRDQVMDNFFKIQGAWANRDMSTVRNLLTDEMYRLLQEDAAKLKAEGKINRLENIAVREVNLTEAWQESGQDYLTCRVYANLLDYVVDDRSGDVITGSKTDPVKFEEYWTFTRPLGNNPWQLAAINQAP